MRIKHVEPHGPLRAKEYPSIGDQLDAIFKLASSLQDQGIAMPPDVLDWLDKCRSVKDKYKPAPLE